MEQVGTISQSASTNIEKYIEMILEKSEQYIIHSKAENTLRNYRIDWRHFEKWCESLSLSPLPSDEQTLAYYISSLSANGYKPSTISRKISAISQAHQAAGYPSPSGYKVNQIMAGIRRLHGAAEEQKKPLLVEHIKQITTLIPDTLAGDRDRALLLIGFFGAFRRSELVAIDYEDVEATERGLKILVRSSKTDQEARGEYVGLPRTNSRAYCPVEAFMKWVNSSSINSGPLFRSVNRHGQLSSKRLSDRSVALIVKKYAGQIGLSTEHYAGHSLRAGFITSAARAGKAEWSIMRQSRHRSIQTVRKYIREGDLFINNAAENLL